MNAMEPYYWQATLVQVMTWCHQAITHYLGQCWPSSMSPCINQKDIYFMELWLWIYLKSKRIAQYYRQTSNIRCTKYHNWDVSSLITRVAPWDSDRRRWLFSAVRGGIWTPHSPVLIKISADKRPLNQLTVKKMFFSLIIKTFCH